MSSPADAGRRVHVSSSGVDPGWAWRRPLFRCRLNRKLGRWRSASNMSAQRAVDLDVAVIEIGVDA